MFRTNFVFNYIPLRMNPPKNIEDTSIMSRQTKLGIDRTYFRSKLEALLPVAVDLLDSSNDAGQKKHIFINIHTWIYMVYLSFQWKVLFFPGSNQIFLCDFLFDPVILAFKGSWLMAALGSAPSSMVWCTTWLYFIDMAKICVLLVLFCCRPKHVGKRELYPN